MSSAFQEMCIRDRLAGFDINIAGQDIVQDHVLYKIGTIEFLVVIPVSYTHLDVYKRHLPAGARSAAAAPPSAFGTLPPGQYSDYNKRP